MNTYEHHILGQNWTSNISSITKDWTVHEHWTVRSKTIQYALYWYGITRFLSVSKNLKKKMSIISLTGGSILLITGILILTNKLQIVGFYLLETFPFLENFG